LKAPAGCLLDARFHMNPYGRGTKHEAVADGHRSAGHLHSVNHRFLLPELLRADHCCSSLDCRDRFAMIRCSRPATQDIRDLFTVQRSRGHFAPSRRKPTAKHRRRTGKNRTVVPLFEKCYSDDYSCCLINALSIN
jgi:hypothetical protein